MADVQVLDVWGNRPASFDPILELRLSLDQTKPELSTWAGDMDLMTLWTVLLTTLIDLVRCAMQSRSFEMLYLVASIF
jgi:hypothetical protein